MEVEILEVAILEVAILEVGNISFISIHLSFKGNNFEIIDTQFQPSDFSRPTCRRLLAIFWTSLITSPPSSLCRASLPTITTGFLAWQNSLQTDR